jgi:hypothetical protein
MENKRRQEIRRMTRIEEGELFTYLVACLLACFLACLLASFLPSLLTP